MRSCEAEAPGCQDEASSPRLARGEPNRDPLSPKSVAKLRQRRKKNKGRVHWDEQAIAEHDKERGTRQKIDEIDTPFVWSPRRASDASSDDEHRLKFSPSARIFLNGCEDAVPGNTLSSQATGDVHPEAVADRLQAWVRSGGIRGGARLGMRNRSVGSSYSGASSDAGENADHSRLSSACSSRSSSSAPRRQDVGSEGNGCRFSNGSVQIEVEHQPKPTSDSFKAKRALHYNEIAVIKAQQQRDVEDTSHDTETSDEDNQNSLTAINTNTNINTTIAQLDLRQRKHTSSDADSVLSIDKDRTSGNPEKNQSRRSSVSFSEGASSERERLESDPEKSHSRRTSVSFSGGESGNESSEDFRSLRRRHYAAEWRRHDPTVAAELNTVEANTNANLNAGLALSLVESSAERSKNPMEGGRPPVQFASCDDDTTVDGGTSSSSEFRALRQRHYDEIAAVRRFQAESGGEESDSTSSSSVAEQAPAESVAALNLPRVVHGTAGNPANPMEPRDPGVDFCVDGELIPPSVDEESGDDSEAARSWRRLRHAHYSEMAAALRSAPPPSDDEDAEDFSDIQHVTVREPRSQGMQ